MPDHSQPTHYGKPVPPGTALPPDEGFIVPADPAEVLGHEGSSHYLCSVCGTDCLIPDGYGWFICPKGHANYI